MHKWSSSIKPYALCALCALWFYSACETGLCGFFWLAAGLI